jgi:hypothetical protein
MKDLKRLKALKLLHEESGDVCWEWPWARNSGGYGHFNYKDPITRKWRSRKAHQIAHELWIGPIPEGLDVTHSCDNPACVNPAHLSAKTRAENMQESFDKGRSNNKGFNHPRTVMNDALIEAIKASEDSYRVLAERYSVGKSTIARVKTGYWNKEFHGA